MAQHTPIVKMQHIPATNERNSSVGKRTLLDMMASTKEDVTVRKEDITVRKGDGKNICICSWKECKHLHAAIQKHADESHEWNGPLHCITMSDSPKCTALRASVQKHLKVDPVAAERKIYYVAPHHWSRSLLAEKKKNGHRTTFLSQAEAKKFDEADNHGHHAATSNQVLVLLRKVKYGLSSKQELAFKYKFVQSPVTSYEDVSSFVKALSSPVSSNGRHERMSKRQKLSLENSKLSQTPLSSSSSQKLQVFVRPTDADFDSKDKIHPHGVKESTIVAATSKKSTTVAATVHVDDSPGICPPLESFNKYFQKKYQELGSDIEAFRSFPNVLRDLKIVQLAYGRDHSVELAPNVHLVHCAGKGSSEHACELFATRSKKPGNVRRPACDSCARVVRVQARRKSRQQASNAIGSMLAQHKTGATSTHVPWSSAASYPPIPQCWAGIR
jgi:hypothetical protein